MSRGPWAVRYCSLCLRDVYLSGYAVSKTIEELASGELSKRHLLRSGVLGRRCLFCVYRRFALAVQELDVGGDDSCSFPFVPFPVFVRAALAELYAL
jgi:hypothetical protein